MASSSRCIPLRIIAGPAMITGRFAAFSASTALSLSTGFFSTSKSRGKGASVVASRRSLGMLRWTGPGVPDLASRQARAMSAPSVATDCAVQEAFVTGKAISACRISWNAPLPSSSSGAWPEISTSGDSEANAV